MKRNQLRWLAAIGLAAPLMAACGATTAGAPAGAALPSCPAAAPKLVRPQPGPRTGLPLIRPGAAAAVICQYAPPLPGGKAVNTPLRRLVLRGTGAAGLVAALDEASPLTPYGTRCDRRAGLLPFDQLIRLSYRTGRPVQAVVTFTSCQLGVVAAAGRSGILASQFQDDLFAYTLITRLGRGPVVPDVIGMRAGAAARRALRRHFGLSVDGEARDAAVPFGTVIFQVLPPGTRDAGPSPYSLGVFVAVRRAAACQPGQLRLDYRGGGAGAGNDFGGILFRDVGPAACELSGRLTITGISAGGQADTRTVAASAASPGVLSPDTAPVRELAGAPPTSMVYVWSLIAEYRDDAASPNGLCARPVVPAAWRVRLPGGFVVTVPNAEAGNPSGQVASGGLVTCRGRLGSLDGPEFFG
ncbi:MAG: hypothetical protein ACLQFR_00965 [Streptosporangiaceae bacterium]